MIDSAKNENQNIDDLTDNDIKLLAKNPLLTGFKIDVTELEDKNTFESQDGILLHKLFYFERERSTKLYINPNNRKLINELSNNSKCLLFWIMFKIPANTDYLKITAKKYMNENNINSINTFKAALVELQANLIICASAVKDVYFINPRLIYSGNRVKQYPKCLQIYKPNNPRTK